MLLLLSDNWVIFLKYESHLWLHTYTGWLPQYNIAIITTVTFKVAFSGDGLILVKAMQTPVSVCYCSYNCIVSLNAAEASALAINL